MIDRELYIAVMDFFYQSGGTYRSLDSATCRDVIDAMDENRYRLIRDAAGNIITFTTWWMIHEKDIELVKSGGRPADITRGTIVYIADHAGKGGYPGLIRFLRTIAHKACWHHRYKLADRFRYYPEKEATNE